LNCQNIGSRGEASDLLLIHWLRSVVAVSASLVNVVVLIEVRPYDQLSWGWVRSHVTVVVLTAARHFHLSNMAVAVACTGAIEGVGTHHVCARASEARAGTNSSMAVTGSYLHGRSLHHHDGLLLSLDLLHHLHLRLSYRLHLHGLHRDVLHSLHGHGLASSLVLALRIRFDCTTNLLSLNHLLKRA
jgi:hypothetical protein